MASAENQEELMSPTPSVTNFPHDVMIDNLLPRLPAKSLARFKCVCKLWLETISDPSFVKSHLTFQTPGLINITQGSILSFTSSTHTDSYELDLSDILGETRLLPIKSCNGLLLARRQKDPQVRPSSPCKHYIINPATGHHIYIPPTVDAGSRPCTKASSVGAFTDCFMHYDNVSHQYKVLGWYANLFHNPDPVYGLVLNNCNSEAEISWMAFRQPNDLIMMWYEPAFFKGWYHWIAKDRLESQKWAILALDMESGQFRVMSVPDTAEIIPSQGWNYRLAMVDDSLYLIQHHCPGNNYCYILWILEDYDLQIWSEVGQYRVEYCQRCKGSGWDTASSASTTLLNVKEIIKRGPQYFTNVAHTNSLAWIDTRL